MDNKKSTVPGTDAHAKHVEQEIEPVGTVLPKVHVGGGTGVAVAEFSVEILKTILNSTLEVMFMVDQTGLCTWISDRVEPVLGYQSRDVIGQPFTRFMPVREIPGFIEHLKKLSLNKEISDVRIKITHKLGHVLDMEINCRWTLIGDKEIGLGTIRNIGDQKRVEDKLNESLSSYKGLFDSVSDAIYIHKGDGVFMDVNRGALRMYGYNREELIGRTPELVSAPGKNDLAEVARKIQQVMETGEPAQFEFWGRRKNGQIFPKEVILHKGKYFGEEVIITTARDISQRKQSEEKLRLYKEIMKHSNEGIAILDCNGVYMEMNAPYLRLTGNTVQELVGQTPAIHFGYEVVEEIMKKLAEKGRFTGEVNSLVTPTDIVFDISSFRLEDEKGAGICLVFILRDISERKKTEQALRESESKYRILAEKMHDVVWILNLELDLVYVSPSTFNTLGFHQDERMKMTLEECLVPESLDHAMQVLIKEMVKNQEGQVDWNREVLLELEYYHKDGSTRWLEQSINGIYDANGELTGIMGVARDITERKKALDELRKSAESYRGLFNSVSDAIYVLNEQGVFIDVNEGAMKMYGYLHHELVGRDPSFVSADGKNDLEAVGKMLQKAYHGEDQRFEFWGKRSCGEIFLKDVRLYPGVYFGQRVIIAMAQDITDRKRYDDALRQKVSELVIENRKLLENKEQVQALQMEVNELLIRCGETARYPENKPASDG